MLASAFKDTRFNLSEVSGAFRLLITRILPSDEGLYFCGDINNYDPQFGNGTYLRVKDQNHINHSTTKVIQDPVSGPVSPGGSETLECVVLTESRTEELSVFWFRPASGASHPGLIYINKSSSGQCEGRCVYTLSKKDVDITDAGTYYCAIATSGHILFGNGTTLRLAEPVNSVLVGLVGALGCSCVVLACSENLQHDVDSSTDTQQRTQAESGDGLNYAALSFSKKESRGRRTRREPPPDAVYAAVRL
ncbi:uncharacterized protein LOC134439348 [Engraulis encrasicolus]|uniref:uncharacterized protein LOC134439348 n=1 Tax=Engraulis encrasicolus TaxID=184585 RepID=UPI002FCE9056